MRMLSRAFSALFVTSLCVAAVFGAETKKVGPRARKSTKRVQAPKPAPKPAEREDEGRMEQGREEWLRLTLGDENGYIPPDALSRNIAAQPKLHPRSLLSVSAVAGLPSSIAGWTNMTGYIHPVGRINDLLIHPTSTNTMWAGTDGGGIWKTTDGGTTWTAANDFLASLSISSFAMRPGDPSTIYAATGPFQSHTFLPGVGIYKSTDGGNNWSLLANTSPTVNSDFQAVNQLAIHPTNSNIVLAATRFGAYITTDGGGVWTKIAGTTTQVNGVAIHPANGNLRVLAMHDGTVKVATDGSTYNPYTISAGSNSYTRIALAPSDPTVMYALNLNGGTTTLYRSATTGATWSPVVTPTGNQSFFAGYLFYTGGLWVDPTNANHIVVDEYWAASTPDASLPTPVWNLLAEGWVDFHGVVGHPGFNGTSNKIVFFFDDGGLYKFNDVDTVATYGNATYLSPNGIIDTEVYSLAGRGGTMIFGAQDVASRFYQPTDPTPKWKFATGLGGHDGGTTAADPLDSQTVYGSTQYLGIHRSKNGGANTGFICQGITDISCGNYSGSAGFIAPFVLDPGNHERMWAGALQLWRSNNVYSGAPPTWAPIHGVGSTASAIAVDPSNSDNVWVAYSNGSVYKSSNATNASPTFTQVTTVPAGFKNRIYIDRTNSLRVFIGLSGFIPNRLYMTPDGGTTWNPASTGLPNAPVFAIQQHPTNASFVYVGNAFGLYASSDGGAHWDTSNQGPAIVQIRDIAWYTDSPAVMLLGTMGRGVWRATIAATSIAAPTSLVATAASTTSVSLTWTAVGGATGYKIYRSSVFPAAYSLAGTVGATTNFTDSTGLTANTSYLYIVRATDGSTDSGDSNIDLATTTIFTDPALTPASTKVKMAHINELRTAVNAVRTLATLSAGSYTDPVLSTSIKVKRSHITDLRTALDAARSFMGLPAVSYTDTSITAGVTAVKAAHVSDLRNGVK
jgi:photosystem II stability/assembly factor-like uncharacterized protein